MINWIKAAAIVIGFLGLIALAGFGTLWLAKEHPTFGRWISVIGLLWMAVYGVRRGMFPDD